MGKTLTIVFASLFIILAIYMAFNLTYYIQHPEIDAQSLLWILWDIALFVLDTVLAIYYINMLMVEKYI